VSGITDLADLLAKLAPELDEALYGFAHVPDPPADLAAAAFAVIREAEGPTVIAPVEVLTAHGCTVHFPCRRITLTVHSALEAVGMMAAVCAALTEAGISTNPVAGFHHDHLFVPADRAQAALDAIGALTRSAG